MDFADIFKDEPIHHMLNDQYSIRKALYIAFSNSVWWRDRCFTIKSKFEKLAANLCVRKEDQQKDILRLLLNTPTKPDETSIFENLKPLKFLHSCNPLSGFAEVKLTKSHAKPNQASCIHNIDKIGNQHILLTTSISSSDSRDSLSDSDNPRQPAKKQRTCQRVKILNLSDHSENCGIELNINFSADILIYVQSKFCETAAKHLGLVSFEELMKDEKNPAARAFSPNAKMYKLAQTMLNQRLISGLNNIVVTNDSIVFRNVQGNVRAAILTDELRAMAYHTSGINYLVVAQDSTVSIIESIGEIISRALKCNITIPLTYETFDGKLTKVDVPVTAVIPFHVMKFLVQATILAHVPNMLGLSGLDYQIKKNEAGDGDGEN